MTTEQLLDPSGIPLEVLANIFQYLPMKSLRAASEACKTWNRASRTASLWASANQRLWEESERLCWRAHGSLGELSRRSFTEKTAGERIEFLLGTVDLVKDYVSAQLRCGFWRSCRSQVLVFALAQCLVAQLGDIDKMLQGLVAEAYALTCNFDILDLALRRLYEELKVLVPDNAEYDPPGPNGHEGIPDPRVYEVVRDPEARALWQSAIGSERCFVHYDVFHKRIIARCFGDAIASNPRFESHLRFHLNFPSSKVVTTYRFHVLLSLFGPFKQLATNFDRYALKPGFLGLVNMIAAEEILAKSLPTLRKNTLLMRYSRRQPEVLAFTSIDLKSKRIEHRRNVDRSGKPIPIALFLEKVFPGYDLIRMGIDDAATKCPNTFTFARHSNPYVYASAEPPALRRAGSSTGSLGRLAALGSPSSVSPNNSSGGGGGGGNHSSGSLGF